MLTFCHEKTLCPCLCSSSFCRHLHFRPLSAPSDTWSLKRWYHADVRLVWYTEVSTRTWSLASLDLKDSNPVIWLQPDLPIQARRLGSFECRSFGFSLKMKRNTSPHMTGFGSALFSSSFVFKCTIYSHAKQIQAKPTPVTISLPRVFLTSFKCDSLLASRECRSSDFFLVF